MDSGLRRNDDAADQNGRRLRGLVVLGLLSVLAHAPVFADEVEKLLFIVIDGDDVIASNTRIGRFDRLKLSAKERIQEYTAGNAVAVVVTNQRYAAYGVLGGGWQGLRRRAGEKTEKIEVQDYSANVVTSDRILNFSGRSGAWNEIPRSKFSFQ